MLKTTLKTLSHLPETKKAETLEDTAARTGKKTTSKTLTDK